MTMANPGKESMTMVQAPTATITASSAISTPNAVVVTWRGQAHRSEQPHRLELRVSDDGPGLSPEMQQHAFEPFFTTEASGTGLGLYLARELCAANGAAIRYEPAADGRPGTFVVEPRPGPAA